MRNSGVALWLLALGLCAAIAARTSFRTDMAAFLPAAAPMAEQVLAAQATSGAASRLLLLAVGGAPAPVLARLSQALAAALRHRPEFAEVLNGAPASFADIEDFVWHDRYLLSPRVNGGEFSQAGLHAALLNDLVLLDSDAGALAAASIPADPTGEAMALQPVLAPPGGPALRQGVWFSPDSRTALLLVQARAAGFDLDGQQRALARLQGDFAAAARAIPGAASARLAISGPAVFAVHIRDTTKADVTRLSLLAIGGAVFLLGFAYRSVPVLLLGILPVAAGALAAIAAVSLRFGFVHGITLGFGVTLIGESLDYAIYLFTQTAQGDAGATLRRIWPTLRLGALTSIAGFAAMLFSDFTGFAQLGLFSITGLLAAAATTRFVLPRLLPRGFSAQAVVLARPVLGLGRHRRAGRAGLALALLAAMAALALHRGGFWDENLGDLSPVSPSDARLDAALRHDFGLPGQRYFAVLQAADAEQALRASESLAGVLRPLVATGALAGFEVPSDILPSAATQLRRRAALPDAVILQARLRAAAAGLPFRPATFAPFLAAAATSRSAPLIEAADLPPGLRLRLASMLAPAAGGWVAMVPMQQVADAPRVAAALASAHLPGLAFIDLDAASAALLARFQREAVTLALAGSAAILLLLLAFLRSPRRTAAVVAPLAAAIFISFALLTLGEGKISIFMVVGLLLIVAVGSNYCLFFERAEADAAIRARAIAAIVLANLCTVCAYGLLSFSRIPVLHDIGRTVALGTFLTLLCGAVLSLDPAPPAAPRGS